MAFSRHQQVLYDKRGANVQYFTQQTMSKNLLFFVKKALLVCSFHVCLFFAEGFFLCPCIDIYRCICVHSWSLKPSLSCWCHFLSVCMREAARARNGVNRNRTALCNISCYLDNAETCFVPLWVLDSAQPISRLADIGQRCRYQHGSPTCADVIFKAEKKCLD